VRVSLFRVYINAWMSSMAYSSQRHSGCFDYVPTPLRKLRDAPVSCVTVSMFWRNFTF